MPERDPKHQELDRLRIHGEWLNNAVPDVMSAHDAYDLRDSPKRFYTVSWWGTDDAPLPVGYTRFTFQGKERNGYAVTWHEDGREKSGVIPATEWVLVFDGRLFVVVDYDDDGNLIIKPTRHSELFDLVEEKGVMVHWEFAYADYQIRILGAQPFHKEGEQQEEIEALVIRTLHLEHPPTS